MRPGGTCLTAINGPQGAVCKDAGSMHPGIGFHDGWGKAAGQLDGLALTR